MSNNFNPSELWKDISEGFENNVESSLSGLKTGLFNNKLAHWNPASSGTRYFKTLLWNLASTLDAEDWQVLSNTTNRDCGNPASMFYHNEFIDLDYLQSVLEFKTIQRFFKNNDLRFLEIGAGYGRTAHVILQNAGVHSYTIIDLPQVLNLSCKYLKSVLTDQQFQKVQFVSTDALNAKGGLEDFVSNNLFYDWAINIDSFAEMDIETVHSYLRLIDKVAKFAYIKNPVGKYEKWMVDDESMTVNMKSVNDALSTGMLQDSVNINSQDEILKASKKFVDSYNPSDKWNICIQQWAKPWHYYWEAVFQKD